MAIHAGLCVFVVLLFMHVPRFVPFIEQKRGLVVAVAAVHIACVETNVPRVRPAQDILPRSRLTTAILGCCTCHASRHSGLVVFVLLVHVAHSCTSRREGDASSDLSRREIDHRRSSVLAV